MIGNILRYRYELIEKLGDGFLFSVFRARDRVQNRIVAVKLVRSPHHENLKLVDALRQSAFSTARLSNPSIARVYEFDEHEGLPFLVVEMARGANLKERIRRVAPLSVPVAIDTAIGIAEGLDAAHRAGIIHADLCPQNVLVGMEGNVKVTDFGLAPAFIQSPEVLSLYHGRAAAYLPPEVSKGEPAGVATDVYSLGIILYEMLTGDLPFTGDTPFAVALQHAQQPLPSLRVLNPGVPQTVEEMVVKATQKQPESRYTTAADMLYDLKTVRDALRFGKPLTWSPMAAGRQSQTPPPATTPVIIPPVGAPPAAAVPAAAVAPTPAAPEPELRETPAPAQVAATREPDPDPEPVVMTPTRASKSEGRTVIKAPKPPEPAAMPEVVYEDSGVPLWLKVVWTVLLIVVLGGIFGIASILFFNWTAPQEVVIPPIVGKTRQEAKRLLEDNGLRMEVTRTDYNEKFPPDTIFFSNPQANKPARSGETVKVWLSRGSRSVRVPDVRNLSEEEARRALEAVELTVASPTRQVSSESVPYGFIVSQTPRAGEKVDRGSVVQLSVSRGPSLDSAAADTNAQADKLRLFNVSVTLPSGTEDVAVRIEVDDANGTRTAWQGIRPPGIRITQQVTGVGEKIEIRVYANEALIKTVTP